MKKIRVCQLITSLRIGGAERVVVDLATRLDRTRFDVHVATAKGGGGFERVLSDASIPVALFDVSGARSPLEFARMVRFLRKRFDIIHAHPGTVARYAGILVGVPGIVSTLHNVYDWKGAAWRGSDRLLNHFTDRIVAVSDAVKDSAVAVYGLPPKRIRIIYNGIDVARFTPADETARLEARRAVGLDADRFWIAGACHLVPHKRPDVLIRATARLRELGTDAALALAGDGPMRAGLEALAGELGVSEFIRFLGVRDDLPRVLQACDAFAHAAIREGLCLVALEALATGLPVAAGRAAALENFIDHERNGLLAPLDDPDALAAALARIAKEPGLAARLGATGRQDVEERFSVDRMVHEHQDLYEELA